MSLKAKIEAIKERHNIDVRPVPPTLPYIYRAIHPETIHDQLLSLNQTHRDLEVKAAVNEHIHLYPHHSPTALGAYPSLEERAEAFLEEEFGVRNKDGNVRVDRNCNFVYEKAWREGKLGERLAKSKVTEEVEALIGYFSETKGMRELSFSRFGGSMAAGGVSVIGFAGLLNGIFVSLGMLEICFALAGGCILGSIHYFGIPLPQIYGAYLAKAKEADAFLKDEVKPYL